MSSKEECQYLFDYFSKRIADIDSEWRKKLSLCEANNAVLRDAIKDLNLEGGKSGRKKKKRNRTRRKPKRKSKKTKKTKRRRKRKKKSNK